MAKRKDNAAGGFKIPIVDAAGQVAAAAATDADAQASGAEGPADERVSGSVEAGFAGEAANAAEGGDEAGDASKPSNASGPAGEPGAGEAAGETAGGPGAAGAPDKPAAAGAPDGANAAEANAAEASVDESSSEDDLVAEAEAIVEEASAAEQLDEARKQAQDWQDRYMRLHAEWDTYRRRTAEQRAEEKTRATEKLVEDLLPVLDDFERSIQYATENGEAGLLDGVRAVQTKLLDSLKKSGLVVIDPAGEAYDALEAQAVATVPDDESFDETVHDVYQKGYKMGKKVLRPAMVTVTTGGPKRPKDDEEPEE